MISKIFEGVVVGDHDDKTVQVQVTSEGPMQGETIAVHDEDNCTAPGANVRFVETAQISPRKRHTLVDVLANNQS